MPARIIAKTVSIILMPLFMPTYGIALLMFMPPYSLPNMHFYRLLTISSTLFFTCLIPGGLIFWMKKTGYISSLTLDERKQRTVPYLLSAISFIAWASFLMEKLHAPHYLVAVAIGAAVALLLVLLVNLRWKISAHLTGWGGFMGGFFGICFQYGINPVSLLILLCLIAGLLIWARLYLHAHTPMQTVTGLYTGFFCSFIPCILF